MMMRSWLNQQMRADPALTALVGTRIYPSTRIREDQSTRDLEKPFIVYRTSSELSNLRGDGSDLVKVQAFQIFVHDIPGDYMQIDSILSALEDLLSDTVDQAAGVIRCEWIENSEDFRDDDMGTILRYSRIQIKYGA